MSIFPLPVFERDADPAHRDALTDEEIYARLKPPTSIVVKFGRMKLIGEYPYRGDAKPGCGSKLVVRTFRAVEIAEMLTTTCSNSGCGKSVSRSEMLEYIDNSGGRDYPFQTNGEVLRVATVEDLNRAAACTERARVELPRVREIAAEHRFPAKVVDLEFTLDEQLLLVYYLCDERIDFRDLAQRLAREYGRRIEMRQVGARDEARLVADYERCGQHCCCKNFLKVLKPISMRSAKVQKATLDPLKISGRCGRLMCCLRYEDATYEELRKRLPRNKTRVGTAEGPGLVVDGKILVQLVLVRLEHDGREIAVPVEELMDPETCPKPGEGAPAPDPMRGMDARKVRAKLAAERNDKLAKQDRYREKSRRGDRPQATARPDGAEAPSDAAPGAEVDGEARKKKRRRRKRKGGGEGGADTGADTGAQTGEARREGGSAARHEPRDQAGDRPASHASEPGDASTAEGGGDPAKRKRRRRRRRGGKPGEGGGPSEGAAPSGD
jgi:cell fate regulator YaaT (PSP1 superfamily)